MNLLSLPPELLTQIFSYINWDELINVKLCTKKFNLVITNYLRCMQKPKIHEIHLQNDNTKKDDIDTIKVTYNIIKSNVNNDEKKVIGKMKELYINSSKLGEFNDFLLKIDLSYLKVVDISLKNHTELVKIFSKYYFNPINVNHIYVNTNNSQECIDNTLSFLQKIENTKNLVLKVDFPSQNVPKNFIIPIKNSLTSIFIHEKEGTTFVNQEIFNYIVKNNPKLEEIHLILNKSDIYEMAIETIVKEQLLRRNYGCSHNSIYLSLGFFSYDTLDQLLSYVYSGKVPYTHCRIPNSSFDETVGVIFYNGKLECSLCGNFDSIQIHGRKCF